MIDAKMAQQLKSYIVKYTGKKSPITRLSEERRRNVVETLVVMVESDWERSNTVFIKAISHQSISFLSILNLEYRAINPTDLIKYRHNKRSIQQESSSSVQVPSFYTFPVKNFSPFKLLGLRKIYCVVRRAMKICQIEPSRAHRIDLEVNLEELWVSEVDWWLFGVW